MTSSVVRTDPTGWDDALALGVSMSAVAFGFSALYFTVGFDWPYLPVGAWLACSAAVAVNACLWTAGLWRAFAADQSDPGAVAAAKAGGVIGIASYLTVGLAVLLGLASVSVARDPPGTAELASVVAGTTLAGLLTETVDVAVFSLQLSVVGLVTTFGIPVVLSAATTTLFVTGRP